MRHRIFLLLALLPVPLCLAHVGSPNVIAEGQAGGYPIRVVIKPPGIVPGLAEISVRILSGQPDKVTVLPVHWRAGLEGAPPPDVARPLPGQPDLYHAELWLMTEGAYSVYVSVEGSLGQGQLIVPVDSVATQKLSMPGGMGFLLTALGMLLVVSFVSITGAAVRESMLDPGSLPSKARLWFSRGTMLITLSGLALALWGGKTWWDNVDRHHQERRMFHPWQVSPSVQSGARGNILELEIKEPDQGRTGWSPLIPDHGKLMHLFLIREPGLDAFAHLHPIPIGTGGKHFQALLPPLPEGEYQLYVDITHESGSAQTLTNHVTLPPARSFSMALTTHVPPQMPPLKSDPEDAWHLSPGIDEKKPAKTGVPNLKEDRQQLTGGYIMTLEKPTAWGVDREVTLRFVVKNQQGEAVSLKPFLGMFSHAALRDVDGRVFNHLHPMGTISMAAQQVFQLRAQGKTPQVITAETLEPFCQDPPASQSLLPLDFPVWFPQPGAYRIWVQIKPDQDILTGVFDILVPN